MIACVTARDVHDWLHSMGFDPETDEPEEPFEYWSRDDGAVVQLPRPNIFGDIPREILDSALIAAGLDMPNFDEHWCD